MTRVAAQAPPPGTSRHPGGISLRTKHGGRPGPPGAEGPLRRGRCLPLGRPNARGGRWAGSTHLARAAGWAIWAILTPNHQNWLRRRRRRSQFWRFWGQNCQHWRVEGAREKVFDLGGQTAPTRRQEAPLTPHRGRGAALPAQPTLPPPSAAASGTRPAPHPPPLMNRRGKSGAITPPPPLAAALVPRRFTPPPPSKNAIPRPRRGACWATRVPPARSPLIQTPAPTRALFSLQHPHPP